MPSTLSRSAAEGCPFASPPAEKSQEGSPYSLGFDHSRFLMLESQEALSFLLANFYPEAYTDAHSQRRKRSNVFP